MEQGTLKIAKRYIIDAGSVDEQWYDDIAEYQLYSERRVVYVVRKNEKSGILDESGRIITPLIYDKIIFYDRHFHEECFYAERDGKAGFITSDNQIIFPFIYNWIDTSFEMGIASRKLGMISFFDDTTKKYGLARWPSGELVQEAQWGNIEFEHATSGRAYFKCGELCRDNQHEKPYYLWNIVDDNGKKLFDSCKYVDFKPGFYSGYSYNVAVSKIAANDSILGYIGLDFEIFYKDGTIVYSGKCYRIKPVYYYDNVFVIESSDSYEWTNDWSLHIYYQDEQGNHVLYAQNFKCEADEVPFNEACYMLENNPELQKMIKAR